MLRHHLPIVPALLAMSVLLTSHAAAQQIVPRIIGGTPTAGFESVGIVGSQQLGGFCSGTLISPTHVLTAAHCAEVIESPLAGTFELDSGVYTTRAIYIHPEFDPRTSANDIAILELSESPPESPSPVFDGVPLPPMPGDVLTIVGFGGDANGGDGLFGIKRSGLVMIDEVTATEIVWTFDDPSESNTAPGDSGGPGFLDIEGEVFVASITSGGTLPDGALGDRAFNTRVDAFIDWIDAVLLGREEPGATPDKPGGGVCPGIDLQQLQQQLGQLCALLQPIVSALTDWCEKVQAVRHGRSPALRSLGQKFGWGKLKWGGRRNAARQ